MAFVRFLRGNTNLGVALPSSPLARGYLPILTIIADVLLPRDATTERGYEIACRPSVRDV